MKVYEVVTEFYDDGSVKAAFYTYELDKKPENFCIETSKCDIYHDYFTSKEEAKMYYDDANRA